jgi:hypothetical protein
MSTFLAVVLIVALLLRIALDITSVKNPKPGFDVAYAVLFFVVGIVLVVDDVKSFWGYSAFGIAAWSLFSFFTKRKREIKVRG